jgi:hypothetical protein
VGGLVAEAGLALPQRLLRLLAGDHRSPADRLLLVERAVAQRPRVPDRDRAQQPRHPVAQVVAGTGLGGRGGGRKAQVAQEAQVDDLDGAAETLGRGDVGGDQLGPDLVAAAEAERLFVERLDQADRQPFQKLLELGRRHRQVTGAGHRLCPGAGEDREAGALDDGRG